jgi:hypothetical protein
MADDAKPPIPTLQTLLATMGDPKPASGGALLSTLLGVKPPTTQPPKPSPFLAAADVYITYVEAASRLIRYARINVEALAEYKKRGISQFETPPFDQSTESMSKLLMMVNRKMDVDFLSGEKEQADALVYGQAAISAWSALEVFVNDVLIAVLKLDAARLAFIPQIRVPVGEFVALDHERRVEYVVELVKQEMRASLSPGVGAFEPTLDAFKLGGQVEDLTRREILEFSAVRNCLAHRKGIVDERFLKACGTTKLKLGDSIQLTSANINRYFYAAQQYAACLLDRIKAIYEPQSQFKSAAAAYLDELKKLQAPE